jgi:hypothetical protein
VVGAGWARLTELQYARNDEPKPSDRPYPNRGKVNGVHGPVFPLGNEVSSDAVRHLKIESDWTREFSLFACLILSHFEKIQFVSDIETYPCGPERKLAR